MSTLRLWPGIVAAVLLVFLRFALPAVWPEMFVVGLVGGLACVLVILVWWLFFSRAPWLERIGAILVMVAAVIATAPLVDISIRGGMMGRMLPLYAVFVLAPALVLGVVVSRRRSTAFRRGAIVVCVLLAMGTFTMLRTAGITSNGSQLAWRWSETPEERLLAQSPPAAPAPVTLPATTSASPVAEPRAMPAASVASRSVAWPGFREPDRDGAVHGIRINADWSAAPPTQLWRRPIGPGWSSFAVTGKRIYTQEQLGEHEIVASFSLATGQPIWVHQDKVRFWESNAGPGPRATPAISNGRLYAFGATGLLNVLDEATGAVLWSHNVAADAGKKTPMWGFSSSPLVIGDTVIVAASGRLVAYDVLSGQRRWLGPDRPGSYSSPHRATIGGVEQVLLVTAGGVIAVAPADGAVLWEHTWPGDMTIVQPAVISDKSVLISTSGAAGGFGIRRLTITRSADGSWTVAEQWTSTGLKPYFNDFVVHKNHAYGFDGAILSCISLDDGSRAWKGGRYGDGQLVLLPDEDLLLVISEEGELALVSATPDAFKEVGRFQAIEGKTWNHPVVVGDTLLVRNGEEMAAFRLAPAR